MILANVVPLVTRVPKVTMDEMARMVHQGTMAQMATRDLVVHQERRYIVSFSNYLK